MTAAGHTEPFGSERAMKITLSLANKHSHTLTGAAELLAQLDEAKQALEQERQWRLAMETQMQHPSSSPQSSGFLSSSNGLMPPRSSSATLSFSGGNGGLLPSSHGFPASSHGLPGSEQGAHDRLCMCNVSIHTHMVQRLTHTAQAVCVSLLPSQTLSCLLVCSPLRHLPQSRLLPTTTPPTLTTRTRSQPSTAL